MEKSGMLPNPAYERRLGHDLAIRPMREDDLPQAHQLSIGVGWPHRPDDWRFVFGLGHGFVACDEIGRVLGSAMWWPFGEDFATLGMVITAPRLQAHGGGRQLMNVVLGETGDRDLRLNSTHAAYRLYLSLGFEPVGRIFQHQGRASPPPTQLPGAGARRLLPADHAAVLALDRAAFGADRSRALCRLLQQAKGLVVEREGVPAGFALCRGFGRGHVVGPVVAVDDAMAIALLHPFVRRHAGGFLRIDTAFESGAFGTFLEQCGLAAYDTVTPMTRGRVRPSQGDARIYGLISQALS